MRPCCRAPGGSARRSGPRRRGDPAERVGVLLAAICITVGGVLVLYLFLTQRIIRGLSAGAVKG
jgi:ABC-type glycerol-3-phosphate transport system permease component